MARAAANHEDNFGSDSFLDVITNFVGILIILVMVVGSSARQTIEELVTPPDTTDLKAAQEAAVDAELRVRQTEAQTQIVDSELEARLAERNQINTLITAIEHELAERRGALDQHQRGRYDFDRDMALATAELAALEKEHNSLEKAKTPKIVNIDCYPTPIGKTLGDKQVHFQLIEGRLTFVPFDVLIEKMWGVVREYSRKAEIEPELVDTVGPVGGFRFRFWVRLFATPQGGVWQLLQGEFLPASRDLGETIDMALATDSTMRERLKIISPNHYAITVHTYPDSFADFRRLKKELYQMGYEVAAFPTSMDIPITVSPAGFTSSSQ